MLDLSKNEEHILEHWKKNGIMDKVRAKNKGKRPFYFLDGPPYVSGDLHPGQMWVKSMKDVVLRYRRFRGYDVYDRAGYDVHGLPIERKVEAKLGIVSKKEIEASVGVENFINSCKEFVDSYIGRMDRDYERFGISLDFSNPYIPSRKEYMETAWGFMKTIDSKGLLRRDKRSTTYCVSCNTAISQGSMEVEYRNDTDPSIMLLFRINKTLSKPRFEIGREAYLAIWTTTPWTLPSNVAVAANPKELYVLARIGERRVILAKDRLDAVVAAMDESATVEKEFYGAELTGLFYVNPLEDKVPEQAKLRKYHKIIFSEEVVSVSEGTGLVHIAPGHGMEDYRLGKENRLPIFSPVTADGAYGTDAGEYAGTRILEGANKAVIEDLRERGSLIDSGTIQHSYPHCWRCDTKLIFIATEQWFINIQRIKEKVVRANKDVSWHPEEAQRWQEDLLVNSPDWTISRQRYWGIPMPIWQCSCGETMVIGSVEELREHAVEKEKVDGLADLHRPYIDGIRLKCRKCGEVVQRIPDVLDVWFDSSIAFRASVTGEQFERLFPMDFILEGRDQLRGWFSYQLKMSIAAFNKRPFDNVVTHGMMLAEDGREMHKRLGNYVSLEEILKTTTADSFRLWCTSHTPELDLVFSKDKINDANKMVTLLYNISNLYRDYSEAIGYVPPKVRKPRGPERLDMEDAWIVSRFNRALKKATGSLDNYEIYRAVNAMREFVVEDFSRFYLKSAKKSVLYSARRKARQTIDIINYILFGTLVVMSTVVPFAAERIYLDTYKKHGTYLKEPVSGKRYYYGKESVFLEDWPKFSDKAMDDGLEEGFGYAIEAITALLGAREKAGVRLRQPLSSGVVQANSEPVFNSLQRLVGIIEDYTNIKKVELRIGTPSGKEIRPLFASLGPDFKADAGAVAESLRAADAEELLRDIDASGHYSLHTEKGTFNIEARHFTIVEKEPEGGMVGFRHGAVKVDPRIDEGLREEAVVREFERKVQMVRKEMGLKKTDRIRLHYKLPEGMLGTIGKNRKGIMKDLNAKEMSELSSWEEGSETEIEGEKARLEVSVMQPAK